MDNFLLIRGARQLLTLHGPGGIRRGAQMNDLGLIEDGAVLVRNEQVWAVGPTRRLENLKESRNAAIIPANGRIVMPGLVDPDFRLITSPKMRGFRPSLSRFTAESGQMLKAALQHGTTRAGIKIGGSSPAEELRALRAVRRLLPNQENYVKSWLIGGPYGKRDQSDYEARRKIADYVRQKSLAESVEVEVDEASASDLAPLIELLHTSGLRCGLKWRGKDPEVPLELLSRFPLDRVSGLDTAPGSLIQWIARSNTKLLVACGEHTLKTPISQTAIRGFLNAGGRLALSSGYDAVQSPTFNLQLVIALAVHVLRLSPEEAVTATTINAAQAAGIGAIAGSLEHGKRADLVLLNLSDYRDLPRQFGVNHVGLALRSGAVVFNRIGWKGPRAGA